MSNIWRACLLLALISGCDGADANEQQAAANDEPTGVTEEGEQIIFAGPRREAATKNRPAGRRSSDYDEERLIRTPNTPDPEQGNFTLEEAVVGLPVDGTLVVEIGTEFGAMLCDLYADRAPRTVANFVGLARGLRPWWDARAGEWVRRPYYQGQIFHRVIPEYLVQGGDYLGDGTGTVGYTIRDENDDTLTHDQRGQLCMANHDGANTAGAQFFVTDGAASELDGHGYTIFGQCRNLDVVSQIARVPQNPEAGNRPLTPIHITRLIIRRVEGGAAQAQVTRPQLPPGEPEQPRGASPDPAALHGGHQHPEGSPLPASGRRGPPAPPTPVPHNH